VRTVKEIEAALRERYNGPTDQVQGSGGKMYTYIPWHENVRVLDEIAGAGNWSEEPVAFVADPAHGVYTAAVKVSIRAFDEDTQTVVEFSRAGFSTSTAEATKNEREYAQKNGLPIPTVTGVLSLHETAADGCASLAFGKACKKLGDALALYLYSDARAGRTNQQSQGYSAPTGGFSGQMSNPDGAPSEKQISFARSLGVDPTGMTKAELSKAIDAAKAGGPAPKAGARITSPADLLGTAA
jgi:hypothetical protein